MSRELSMKDSEKIASLYVDSKWTMRQIAKFLGTDHHHVRRVLIKIGIEPTRTGRLIIPVSEEAKKKMSISKLEAFKNGSIVPWAKGKKMTDAYRRKQTRTKLRLPIDFDLDIYDDLEKFQFLSRTICRHRNSLAKTEDGKRDAQMAFVGKFYFDSSFNFLYDRWKNSGRDRWYRPTLDHINPKSKGGNFDFINLRFITWFENRAKADMPIDEWEAFKLKTNTTSKLFISEQICK